MRILYICIVAATSFSMMAEARAGTVRFSLGGASFDGNIAKFEISAEFSDTLPGDELFDFNIDVTGSDPSLTVGNFTAFSLMPSAQTADWDELEVFGPAGSSGFESEAQFANFGGGTTIAGPGPHLLGTIEINLDLTTANAGDVFDVRIDGSATAASFQDGVSVQDADIEFANASATFTAPGGGGSTDVPEPASAVLLVLAFSASMRRTRR